MQLDVNWWSLAKVTLKSLLMELYLPRRSKIMWTTIHSLNLSLKGSWNISSCHTINNRHLINTWSLTQSPPWCMTSTELIDRCKSWTSLELSLLLKNYHLDLYLIQIWYSLEPEIEKNAKRRVYWNHSVGWLRMHEFILNQQGDMFDTFIMHVK